MKERNEKEFDDLEPLSSSAAPAPRSPRSTGVGDRLELADLPDDVELHAHGTSAGAHAVLEELATTGSAPSGSTPAGGKGAPPDAARRPGGAAAKRELDKAPLELRKASIVLLAGSIFPWANPLNLAVGPVVEKLFCYLAIWIFYQSHVLKHTGKANGLVASLGKKTTLVPMIVAGVIAIVGLTPIATGDAGGGGDFWASLGVIMEKAFLLLGGYTLVHIYDYEHGGKFNPLFPLLFLFPAVAGFASIFTRIVPQFGERPAAAGVALLGAVFVALGGLIACHTMYTAMKEAKAHGEAKKQAALESRRAAREARKDRSPGSGPPA